MKKQWSIGIEKINARLKMTGVELIKICGDYLKDDILVSAIGKKKQSIGVKIGKIITMWFIHIVNKTIKNCKIVNFMLVAILSSDFIIFL